VKPDPDMAEFIRLLSNEAGEHGDLEQVAICERALAGDDDAIAECIRVAIRESEGDAS
jgi:hypothetical protein